MWLQTRPTPCRAPTTAPLLRPQPPNISSLYAVNIYIHFASKICVSLENSSRGWWSSREDTNVPYFVDQTHFLSTKHVYRHPTPHRGVLGGGGWKRVVVFEALAVVGVRQGVGLLESHILSYKFTLCWQIWPAKRLFWCQNTSVLLAKHAFCRQIINFADKISIWSTKQL
jgi:hypothetical protein